MQEPTSHLKAVIEFWQPFYPGITLTEDDAREIEESVGSVFEIINRWDFKGKENEKRHVER